tara:strand:- start:272 stop:1414 length:1143 start_codon:yes stop_codon:yes gene_type:complete
MAGNPLSGHTNANVSLSGSASAADKLIDGSHILSPSITNLYEGVHGNGILLLQDTASGDSNRSVPEDLPGVIEQQTNAYTVRVTGGHCVLDGVVYTFANGPGSYVDIALTNSAGKKGSPAALSGGQEALIVMYVSSDGSGASKNVFWEMGTPVTTASSTYPSAPVSFLNFPDAALTVKQTVVLAVLRVVYAAGGDYNVSVSESNDKRVFLRPSPIYFTPVTSGAVGATTAVDSHIDLDALHTGSQQAADFGASTLGGLWQSFGDQIGSTTAADNDKDVLYYSATHAARFTRSVFDRVLTTAATSLTIKSSDANILILTARSGTCGVVTSGCFPAGYIVEILNQDTGDTATFEGATVAASGYGRFVCTVSDASNPTFVRLQ